MAGASRSRPCLEHLASSLNLRKRSYRRGIRVRGENRRPQQSSSTILSAASASLRFASKIVFALRCDAAFAKGVPIQTGVSHVGWPRFFTRCQPTSNEVSKTCVFSPSRLPHSVSRRPTSSFASSSAPFASLRFNLHRHPIQQPQKPAENPEIPTCPAHPNSTTCQRSFIPL